MGSCIVDGYIYCNTILTSTGSGTLCLAKSHSKYYIAACTGCHNNGLKTTFNWYYAVSIVVALLTGVERAAVAGYAALFVLLRVVYTCVYLSAALDGLLRTAVYARCLTMVVGMMGMLVTADATVYDTQY
jgi:uncharacterized MAPEG superfamily protein